MAGKTLVGYFSKSGATETYARAIAETLAGLGINAELVNLRQKKPVAAEYDCIVLGTGIRMFMVYRKWRRVLKQKEVREKRLFLFLSSGMAIREPDKAVEKFVRPIVDKFGLKPVSVIAFPGAIPEKWRKDGEDKDTVKPEKAREWARGVAGAIKGT